MALDNSHTSFVYIFYKMGCQIHHEIKPHDVFDIQYCLQPQESSLRQGLKWWYFQLEVKAKGGQGEEEKQKWMKEICKLMWFVRCCDTALQGELQRDAHPAKARSFLQPLSISRGFSNRHCNSALPRREEREKCICLASPGLPFPLMKLYAMGS